MANNIPFSGKLGKTPPTATSGGGVKTGPPAGKESPSGAITPDAILAKTGLDSAGSENIGDSNGGTPATPMSVYP